MTLNALWRLIRSLLVALGAPAAMIARVWRRDTMAMRRFARLLALMRGDGLRLRYADEDGDAAHARVDMLAWIARDPLAAARRMARRATGVERARLAAKYAPVSFAPPVLAQIALAFPPVHDPLTDIDTC